MRVVVVDPEKPRASRLSGPRERGGRRFRRHSFHPALGARIQAVVVNLKPGVEAERLAQRVSADEGGGGISAFPKSLRERRQVRGDHLSVVSHAMPAGNQSGHEGSVRRESERNGGDGSPEPNPLPRERVDPGRLVLPGDPAESVRAQCIDRDEKDVRARGRIRRRRRTRGERGAFEDRRGETDREDHEDGGEVRASAPAAGTDQVASIMGSPAVGRKDRRHACTGQGEVGNRKT